jgi:hypothetical protein
MGNEQGRSSVESWVNNILPLAALTQEQEKAVQELLGHSGVEVLVGLMLGTREAFLVMLASLPLNTPANVTHASVLQGQIKGIDLLRHTLIELSVPETSAQPQGANR